MDRSCAERDAFTSFVLARQTALVRLGWALTGDRQLGEDLAQNALQRLWPHWDRVAASGEPLAYTQKIMVNLWSSWRSGPIRRRELVGTSELEPPAAGDPIGAVDDDDAVRRWLAVLPARQRATIVLRFLLDLSVEDAATTLGCSTGTVKSQTARALKTLGVRLAELAGSRDEGTGS